MNKYRALIKRRNELYFLDSLAGQLTGIQKTKMKFAKLLFPGQRLSATLPRDWLAKMKACGFEAEPHFVAVEQEHRMAICIPITAAGIEMLIEYAAKMEAASTHKLSSK